MLTLFVLVVAGCGGTNTADPDLVNLAVRATLDAMPTQPVVEVTVIVVATPTPNAAVQVTVNTPTPESATDDHSADQSTNGEQNTGSDSTESTDTEESVAVGGCPNSSTRTYDLIPMDGVDLNHPDNQHGDWNLSLRGYERVEAPLHLVDLGNVDPDTPQLARLFAEARRPDFLAVHQVRDWDWGCGDHGCAGDPLAQFEVTLLTLASNPGESLAAPGRGPEIYGGGYIAAVLYAEPTRIVLSYTRAGTAAEGYAVHLENICVDPNLVAAYQAANAAGRTELPALRNAETFGNAASGELMVAIRSRGMFLDPRSRDDWWQGY
ncbi:hypothetical protein KFU94_47055 [Chloroflexi bacterium TSY]|nr:hypothetical protein [Chloroflexi bacterium TSY]